MYSMYIWVIGQASGQDDGILAKVFICMAYMDRAKGFVMDFTENNTCINGTKVMGNPERARCLHLDCAGTQSWHRICFTLPTSTASHIISVK